MHLRHSPARIAPLLAALATLALAETYTSWRSAQFTSTELADATISGAAADPDGDGIPNLH